MTPKPAAQADYLKDEIDDNLASRIRSYGSSK